ncbi:hypothetical protein [Klebsiella quasipneumoniae]|nr:hypothetical protein [Klebsiella quasipneumoniae]
MVLEVLELLVLMVVDMGVVAAVMPASHHPALLMVTMALKVF